MATSSPLRFPRRPEGAHVLSLLVTAMPLRDPCQKQACAIQTCLQANRYVESLCEDVIRDMQRCCQSLSADRQSVCCTGFSRDQNMASRETKTPASLETKTPASRDQKTDL
ncbi:hypothetical protein CRUP_028720 [Coryphaenoides rupestris]|nr:hypothetical protein CRUP_028720 [Coryphaenoides rupestris]